MARCKRIGALVLAIVCLCACLPVIAEDYPFVGYIKDDLRMRKTPSSSGAIVMVMPAGEAVLIVGQSGNYYIVQYDGTQGYALKSFITVGVATPAPTPDTTPSTQAESNYPLLRSGDSGAYVKALQEALKELGFYTGTVDEKFGSGTMNAVKAFQKQNGMTQTGMADAALQELLFQGAPYNASGRKKSVSTLPQIPLYPIRRGDRGDAVVTLQQMLTQYGYYTGAIDGECGSGTVAAVRAFQKKNGLKADGVAGEGTLTLLYQGSPLSADGTPTPKPTATPSPTPTPKPVYPYQTTVNAAVNLRKSASLTSARITTVKNGASIMVLKVEDDFLQVQYQTYTGYVLAQYVNIPQGYDTGSDLPGDEDAQKNYVHLQEGSAGSAVKALQQALDELGYLSGNADGLYGAGTTSAVKALQKKNKLSQTGATSPELQKMIFEGTIKNSKGVSTDVKTLPPIDGYIMRPGDKGDAVIRLQNALRALGYFTGVSTGAYGDATTNAVKSFQRNSDIPIDGVAGQLTQLLLFKAAATPTPMPEGVVVTPSPVPSLDENSVVVMYIGTRGLAVTALQQRLLELGYSTKKPDGIYSLTDKNAVKAFQKKNGLDDDGIAGLSTQLVLYGPFAEPMNKPAEATPTPEPETNKTLRAGMTGYQVMALQNRLICLEYLTVAADGIYGASTTAAVRAFQERNNLHADGVAGSTTLELIYGKKAKSAPTPTAMRAATDTPKVKATATPAPNQKTLRMGSTGAEVVTLQKRLISLGYLSGKADGIYGPGTRAAVRSFQKNNGLGIDGEAGASTQSVLYSDKAVAMSGAVASPTTTPHSGAFVAPDASQVRFTNWFSETRARARNMPNVIIYDYNSGLHWNMHMFSFGKHADSEPPTAQDTAIMNQAFGEPSWTPHPVWVMFSDGRVYLASMHNNGHEVDHTSGNDMTGHVCIHFPRDMDEAAQTGPYAVQHQKAILIGWQITQTMIK